MGIRDEHGRYSLEIRKAQEGEIYQGPDGQEHYKARKDYLNFMQELRREKGFSTGRGKIARAYNEISNISGAAKMEGREFIRSTRKNFVPVTKDVGSKLKTFFEKLSQKKIEEDPKEKMEKLAVGKTFLERKNPYREEKFARAVSTFRQEGILQVDFAEALAQFTNSEDGMFLRDKQESLADVKFSRAFVHGRDHSDRVAILSMMIARGEGLLSENSDREREILSQAAYYHDIGRILPSGPHAKRSAKIVDGIEMRGVDRKTV